MVLYPMIDQFDKNAHITVREISSADWEAYRDFYRGMKRPQHFSGFMQDKDLNDPQSYQALFEWLKGNDPTFTLFGMFDGHKMIGQTSLSFMDIDGTRTAYLAGSEITDDYRGQRLVDKLYDTRMEHLRRMNFDGPVIMTIHPDNTNSHKAAARNGFAKTGEQDPQGYDILMPVGMK